MRYMLILAVTFAVYFWAVHNIGEKYVPKYHVNLPPPPPQSVLDVQGGKYRLQDLQKPTAETGQSTVHVVDY